MTASRRLAPARFAALTLTALGLACVAGAVCAQDPAFIGGSSHNDPANVQSRGSQYAMPARSTAPTFNPFIGQSAPQPADPNAGPMAPQDAVKQLQAMIGQMEAKPTTSQRYNPYDRSQQMRYNQAMRQAQGLMSRNGNQFSASTKALFLEMQALDADMQREQAQRDDFLDTNPSIALERGMGQAEKGMSRLNDVLMPMLQDMKRAVDTELRNGANRRRP